METGEMVPQLLSTDALTEAYPCKLAMGEYPAPTLQPTTACDSSYRGSDAHVWPLWVAGANLAHTHAGRHSAHMHKNKSCIYIQECSTLGRGPGNSTQ